VTELGDRVQGFGCQVSGFGFRISGFGFRVEGGFKGQSSGRDVFIGELETFDLARIKHDGSRVEDEGFRVEGSECRGSSLESWNHLASPDSNMIMFGSEIKV